MPNKQPNKNNLRTLAGSFLRSAENNNQFTLSFSSEEPYKRWGVSEILDHSDGAVDLTRLKEMGVLLFNHWTNDVLGKVVSVAIENNRGVAVVEFDNDDEAQKIRNKVENGTLKGVSVRYDVKNWEEVEAGEKSLDGRFEGPCIIARKWEPLEISIVSVPADASVGVGRSHTFENNNENEEGNKMPANKNYQNTDPQVTKQTPPAAAPNTPADNQDDTQRSVANSAAQAERERIMALNELSRSLNYDVTEHIQNGDSVETVHAAIIERQVLQNKETNSPLNVRVSENGRNELIRDAAHGLILRDNPTLLKNPSDGAQAFRNHDARQLLIECARQEGATTPDRMSNDALLRQYFTPSSVFASVINTVVEEVVENSALVQDNTTFESWTQEGTLKDFKSTRRKQLGAMGEFKKVPEGGEIKHVEKAAEYLPERKLDTYGLQLTLTREAIINNDFDAITKLPAEVYQGARNSINREVYALIGKNPLFVDGAKVFSSTHKNLITPGTKPDKASILAMIKLMAAQKDGDGQLVRANPRFILAPFGYGGDIYEILYGNTIISNSDGSVTTAENRLAQYQIQVIEDMELNEHSDIAYYMASGNIPTIQVDYLNGNKTPVIRTMEYAGQLGMIFDVYLDWGISIQSYRGLVKNEGQA